jgi:hypothetical protein
MSTASSRSDDGERSGFRGSSLADHMLVDELGPVPRAADAEHRRD